MLYLTSDCWDAARLKGRKKEASTARKGDNVSWIEGNVIRRPERKSDPALLMLYDFEVQSSSSL